MLKLSKKPKPLVLCILDGWGMGKDNPGNAITEARPVFYNSLWHSYPHTVLLNSGKAVGLPEGLVGNSEVGHLNLGAGRIVYQDLLRINIAIKDGSFYENPSLIKALDHVRKNNSNLHFMGLVSVGSVHSQIEHLYALLEFCKKNHFDPSRVQVHAFTDGRDSPPKSAKPIISKLEDYLKKQHFGPIASVSGRYYAMDRDNRWERTEKAYVSLTGLGDLKSPSCLEAIENSYKNGLTDEFIKPTIIVDGTNSPIGPIATRDTVVFFNYRPDRARQLTKAFVLESFGRTQTSSGQIVETFGRGPKIPDLFFATMTQYEAGLPVSATLFAPQEVNMPLSRILSQHGLRQLHIAETEKYAHVTYFFNGGKETPFVGEDRILISSQKVASYDQVPQMSAPEITKQLVNKISSGGYDFIVANYANADMVAHTGNLKATVKAIQVIDNQLQGLVRSVVSFGGGLIITSDHGNAEEMINPKTGGVDTEHNNNSTPCIFIIPEFFGKRIQLRNGILADVAPTILAILGIIKPSAMTGHNLLA